MYLNDGAFVEMDGQALLDAAYPQQQSTLDFGVDTANWMRRRQQSLAEKAAAEERAKLAVAVAAELAPAMTSLEGRITALESRVDRASEIVGNLVDTVVEDVGPRLSELENFRATLIQLNIAGVS